MTFLLHTEGLAQGARRALQVVDLAVQMEDRLLGVSVGHGTFAKYVLLQML
jgi:hypothetical protein